MSVGGKVVLVGVEDKIGISLAVDVGSGVLVEFCAAVDPHAAKTMLKTVKVNKT